MSKKLLKRLSVIVCAVFVATMVGCGKADTENERTTQPKEPEKTTAAEKQPEKQADTKFKLGFNNYLKGFYALDILENNAKFAAEVYGNEFVAVNDEAKTEKVIQNVQNLISSGVKGIVFFGIVDTVFPVVSQMCEKAKVPFVVFDHLPSEKSLETLRKNPYFVGAVGEKDYDAGYPIGEYAAKSGLKKAIIVTGQRGDTTHEARVKGFTDAFTKGGGQVIDVGYVSGSNILEAAMQKTEDILTAHPDVDCMYGSGGDYGLGAIQGLKKHSNVKAKVYMTDLDPKVLEGLSSGDIAAANGAHWVNASFSVALLQNYLTNHQLKDKDGQAPVVTVPILVLPSNQTDLYKKFWLENQPFSADEIKNLCNGSITLDEFQNVLNNYSIKERLTQKVKEGKLTEDDLKKAGVTN